MLLALAILGFFYYQEIQSSKTKENIDPVLSEVGKLMVLPGEVPQIVTIDNVDQTLERDAAFFKNTKVGDKLIVYQYLSILYDPKAKKIVNVQTFTPPPPTPSIPLRISFRYNGNAEERAKNLKKQLETTSPFYQIVEITESDATYKNDVIYLINPARKQDIKSFAQTIGDSPIIDLLEPNEATPDADLIVAFSNTSKNDGE